MKKYIITLVLTLAMLTVFSTNELICVYNIVYPEFWESTTTITSEALGHFETYFIDGVPQYETRDGRRRMIYYFDTHPSGERVFFYGGFEDTISSSFSHCYEDDVLETEDVEVLKPSVYPNPSTDVINVGGIEVDELSLWDIQGREVRNNINSNTIDVSGLSTGLYILRIRYDNKARTEKVLVK